MGEGEVVLRERKRLTFIAAGEGQVLMDYDVTLHAGEKDVTFKDNKDGGLGIRVASTMKVRALARHLKDSPSFGAIQNSRGDKDDAAWGKRAEWVDCSGPDASGRKVGVAMFDHPGNLRAPTGWHARYYGLLTANRFAIGSFGRESGAKKGDGDYTIPKGESLQLRHRFLHPPRRRRLRQSRGAVRGLSREDSSGEVTGNRWALKGESKERRHSCR